MRKAVRAVLRGRRLGRIGLCLATAVLVFCRAPACAQSTNPGSAARPLVAAARDAWTCGSPARAQAYVIEALDIDATDSDALHIAALLRLKQADDAASALALEDAALAAGHFDLYAVADARDLDAALLVRLRRWNECLALLGPLSATESARDPEIYRLRALARFGLGDRAGAIGELRAAAQRFPDEPRFARIFFERCSPSTPTEAERALGEIFAKRLRGLSDQDPELLVLGAPFMLDAKSREDSVRAYRAQGAASAASTLRSLEYGIIGDDAAIEEFFSGRYGIDAAALRKLEDLLGSAEGRARLVDRLKAFGGIVAADRDGDGVFEESAEYRDGSLVSWRLDADQSGNWGLRVQFDSGLPSDLVLQRAGLETKIHYDRYPYVALVTFSRSTPPTSLADLAAGRAPDVQEYERYRMGPDSLVYAPLVLSGFPGRGPGAALFLPEPSEAAAPTPESAASCALAVERTVPPYSDVVWLERGIPVRRERYLDGRLYSVLTYELGRPSLEKVDADGDGRFETERVFDTFSSGRPDAWDAAKREDPQPAWVLVDADGDGFFGYREEMAFPFRKEWDLDKNGTWDAILQTLSDGGSRLDLSSRLDGVFDESVTFDAKGRIVSLTRYGKPAVFVDDANPRLRWIGSKPFDIGSNLPAAGGIYPYMNRRYSLVYVGQDAFAELVP